jgi:hypothetical protein
MTPMEFILRFTFTNPDLDTTIVGTITDTPADQPRYPGARTVTAGSLRGG